MCLQTNILLLQNFYVLVFDKNIQSKKKKKIKLIRPK